MQRYQFKMLEMNSSFSVNEFVENMEKMENLYADFQLVHKL